MLLSAPLLWWVSRHNPVTFFSLHRTLVVTSGTCGRWETTVLPESNEFGSHVAAVDALSSSDLWVVTKQGKVLRGEGQHWRTVQTLQTLDGEPLRPEKIDMRSANDGWIVGRGAVFHWNGARFEQVTGGDLPEYGYYYESVAAISENDAWLTGPGRIWHWNGRDFRDSPIAGDAFAAFFMPDVSAASRDDAWIVGTRLAASTSSGGPNALVAHWDGEAWRDVRNDGALVPQLGDSSRVLALGHGDVWALQPQLALHLNGSKWQFYPATHNEGFPDVWLHDLDAVRSTDVWAVGYALRGDPGSSKYDAFAMHWDGARWSIVPAPRPLDEGALDVVKVLPGRIWAAGEAFQDEFLSTHYVMYAEFLPGPCPRPGT